MDTQARLDTQLDTHTQDALQSKSILKRTLACFALVCLMLGPVAIVHLMIRTLWGEGGEGEHGNDHTTVYQRARLSHGAFAPLEINYAQHLPLLNMPNGPSSFRPLSFATVTVTSHDRLALLHTLARSTLPCAILRPSLSSAESPYDPTVMGYAFSAATNASTALGNLDDYYAELLRHYQQLLVSSVKSEQALRPAWFKSVLCTQKAWVKRYLGDPCLFTSDIERHTRSKAWVVTVKDGIEGAKDEKKGIAKKKVEVRRLEADLALFGARIRKEGTVGRDDVKRWYFENVAQVGGQVWRDFDREFGTLDCTIRDDVKVDLGAKDTEVGGEEEEEEGRWNMEEIWA